MVLRVVQHFIVNAPCCATRHPDLLLLIKSSNGIKVVPKSDSWCVHRKCLSIILGNYCQ